MVPERYSDWLAKVLGEGGYGPHLKLIEVFPHATWILSPRNGQLRCISLFRLEFINGIHGSLRGYLAVRDPFIRVLT